MKNFEELNEAESVSLFFIEMVPPTQKGFWVDHKSYCVCLIGVLNLMSINLLILCSGFYFLRHK